jgi:hypothetical protein
LLFLLNDPEVLFKVASVLFKDPEVLFSVPEAKTEEGKFKLVAGAEQAAWASKSVADNLEILGKAVVEVEAREGST